MKKDLDYETEKRIRTYLNKFKNSKNKTVNILDLIVDLNLPPEQIKRIMTKLEKEGIKRIER